MGFGIIFIGYLFTVFDMGNLAENTLSMIITQLLCLIGYAILLYGLDKFAQYVKFASWAKGVLLTIIPAALCNVTVQALWYTGVIGDTAMANVRSMLAILLACLYAAFHWFFIKALDAVADETDCISVKRKAKISLAATSVFSALNIVANLPILGMTDILAAPRYMLFIAVTIINAITIFSAYMWICLPDDVDMEPKKRGRRKGGADDE